VKWTNTIKIDYIAKHPEYGYKLWTESNIDELFVDFPNIKIIYDLEETWNGKSDLLRYLILYYYGGIYIDADTVWLNEKNFDDLIENSTGFFAAKDCAPVIPIIVGSVIGTYKKNEVFIKILKRIEGYIISKGGIIKPTYYVNKRKVYGVCKLIGPDMFDHYAKHEDITIFPSHYFYPISWHGITDSDYHLKHEMPQESDFFQYGYSTNKLQL